MGWYGPRGNCGCCQSCWCQINGETESEDVYNRIFRPAEEVWTITNIPSSVDYYYFVRAFTFAKFTINGIDAINGTYTFEGGQGPYNLEFPVFGTCGLLLPDGWVTEAPEVFSSFSVSNAYWLSIGTLSAIRDSLNGPLFPPLATEVDVWLAHVRPAIAYTPVSATDSWHLMYVFMHCADTGESFFAVIGSHLLSGFDREDLNSCEISNVRWYRETAIFDPYPRIEHYGEGSTVETILP